MKQKRTSIKIYDLEAIIFWACVGISESEWGHKAEEMPDIIRSLAKRTGIPIHTQPDFKP